MARTTLEAVLRDAQRIGLLGARPIPEVIEHAQAFVAVLPSHVHRVIDLGSGAGVPGLVVAAQRPDLRVTLVDRRRKRTDVLERAVRSLGWADRCEVWWCDVAEVVRRTRAGEPGHERWDVVMSRGFGPPDLTVTWARELVKPEGLIVISEPPPEAGDRWTPERLANLGVTRVATRQAGVVMLTPRSG